MNSVTRCFVSMAIVASLTGCGATQHSRDARDPFEGFNRAMFTFNDKLDQVALKPAAIAYRDNLPTFVQTAVGNFFGNIADVWTAVNQLLQGKVADGLSDGMRVAVNTVLGFGGLLDISSEAGLPKHKQDFGVTLGVWGVSSGPYVVLPFIGPSTMRDTAALPADFRGDLWGEVTPVYWRNTGSVVRVVDQRAYFLSASNLLEDAALDRYEFVKDAYLQRRANKIYDGEAPYSSPPDDDISSSDSFEVQDSGATQTASEQDSVEPVTVSGLQPTNVAAGTMESASESDVSVGNSGLRQQDDTSDHQ